MNDKHVRRRGPLHERKRHAIIALPIKINYPRCDYGVQFNGLSVPDRPKLAGQGLFDPRLAAVQNRGHQIAPGSARETRLLTLPLLADCLHCSWSVNNAQCAGFENSKRVGYTHNYSMATQ